MTSATAFGIVSLLGAGYLMYLGIRTLRGRDGALDAAPARTSRRLFADGVVVSALNPKIAVFFLAVLPQFVDAGSGPVTHQMIVLALLYCGMALVTDGTYAMLAGTARNWLGARVREGPIPRYVSGGVYVGLGVATELTGRTQSD
jgi:threonine/homoserine/homoserine lactone efflux protein